MQITEQPSFYDHLEKKSVREILEDINQEDQKVALAVQKAIPQIEELVNQIVPRMKQGGRIFYMGAGTSGRLGVLDASEIPPTFGMSPNWIIGLIAGGDTALRNPVEGAEDDENRGWEELVEHQINEKDTVIGIAASGTAVASQLPSYPFTVTSSGICVFRYISLISAVTTMSLALILLSVRRFAETTTLTFCVSSTI